MTPEEKAAELLTLNADKAQNDSWLLPVELEQRIAQAIREAKIEAYGEAMQILDKRSAIAEDGDVDTGASVAAGLDDAFVEICALRDSLHEHTWIDARNEIVASGEICLDCGSVRASTT